MHPSPDTPSTSRYALILAGGSGTRFWPLSRDRRPKQLIDLFDEGTLLAQTVTRLEGIVPTENILILTNSVQADAVREILPELPSENIIAEPEKRDTAPAIALGVGLVAARNPEATMAVLPSDHLIQDTESYGSLLAATMDVASENTALLTIGIKPTWACPGYGYIERGAAVSSSGEGIDIFEVEQFHEKPSPEKAEGYLREGTFAWNAGMFVWSVGAVRAELAKNAPELDVFIESLANSEDPLATVDRDFGTLPKLSIDFALMEKADTIWNVEATFDWDDVGSWVSIAKYLPGADSENSNATNSPLTAQGSTGNIVFTKATSPTHVALLGVDDLVIVQTEDALLVADKHKADEIKKIVGELPDELH